MPGLLLREYSLGMKYLLVTQKPDREVSVSEDQEVLKLRMNRIFKPSLLTATERSKNIKGIRSHFRFRAETTKNLEVICKDESPRKSDFNLEFGLSFMSAITLDSPADQFMQALHHEGMYLV